MKIRKAKKEDLKEIARIFKTESNKKPYVQGWTDKSALKKIQNTFKDAEILLYIHDGKIAGFVSIIREKEKSEYYIDEMWFDKKYQGKDFGTELIDFIEQMCRKKGLRR
jgi:N-acetylglutamate synthase-like GNAT family acetyltransferase